MTDQQPVTTSTNQLNQPVNQVEKLQEVEKSIKKVVKILEEAKTLAQEIIDDANAISKIDNYIKNKRG